LKSFATLFVIITVGNFYGKIFIKNERVKKIMKKDVKNKLPLYFLIAFLVGTMLYIFIAPIYIVKSIEKDSKRPKQERVYGSSPK